MKIMIHLKKFKRLMIDEEIHKLSRVQPGEFSCSECSLECTCNSYGIMTGVSICKKFKINNYGVFKYDKTKNAK